MHFKISVIYHFIALLGYTKRSQKTSAETPKKPQVSYKFSASKQEKPDDVSPLSSGKDRNLSSKAIEPSNKAKEQIKELKNKCLDCEKKINDLKIGLNEKNLAMEAFVIIIRRYIENVRSCHSSVFLFFLNSWTFCHLELRSFVRYVHGH